MLAEISQVMELMSSGRMAADMTAREAHPNAAQGVGHVGGGNC